MANFAKGFVQGFSPNISNASDLISRMLIKQYDNSMDLKAQDQKRKYDEQQQKLIDTQDQAYYDSYISDPLKYGAYLGKMSPGMRVAANEWVSKQPKIKYDERTDETGKHLIKQKIDWQGNVLEEQIQQTIPYEVRKETVENGGTTQTWKIMSDGSRVLGDKKVDYNYNKKDKEALKKKEDSDIVSFRKEVLDANKSFSQAGIYKTQADVKASNAKNPQTPDYSHSSLVKLDYDNKKAILKFKAQQTMSPTSFEALNQIDQWNDPTVYKEDIKQLIIDLRKEGASQSDVSKIASWYLLKTGKELE